VVARGLRSKKMSGPSQENAWLIFKMREDRPCLPRRALHGSNHGLAQNRQALTGLCPSENKWRVFSSLWSDCTGNGPLSQTAGPGRSAATNCKPLILQSLFADGHLEVFDCRCRSHRCAGTQFRRRRRRRAAASGPARKSSVRGRIAKLKVTAQVP
jgi:hypothetical protein